MKAFEIFIPIVLVVGSVIGFQSCCPKHYPQIVYRDSVRVEIRERLVHDTVAIEVPKIVEKNVTRDTISHLENDWAESDVELKDGFLWHSLATKGKTVYVPVQVPVHDTLIVEKEAQETIIEKEVEKPLSWWQRLKIGAFWWLLGGLLLLAVWVFRKPILDLIRRLLL